MSAHSLLEKKYEPFLCFGGWGDIQHIVRPFKRFIGGRLKSLAVSDDGRVLRFVISETGYNDEFKIDEDGAVVLRYVCGNAEETRRLHKLRHGDAMHITLDQKAGKAKPERHGILHGRFRRIEKTIDRKADGEFLVPRAIVQILGYETEANTVTYFDTEARPYLAIAPAATSDAVHMIIDTESSPPSSGQPRTRCTAFPVLEIAFRIVGYDFAEEFTAYRSFVRYPEHLTGKLGNDSSSAVLKFNPAVLAHGDDVHAILQTTFAFFRRTHASGGAVIGHNVLHDIGQLQATAGLVGYVEDPFVVNVFDTVRSASSFVAGSEVRWMKLYELAQCCGVTWDASDPTRGQHRAAGDVEVLHRILRAEFDTTHFKAFYEEVQFSFTR